MIRLDAFSLGEDRKEQCGDDGDDRDHRQKLDQGEGAVYRAHAEFSSCSMIRTL
jgi:hypothetical protein